MGGKQAAVIVLLVTLTGAAARGQGIVIPVAGPVNRAMGGASTAAPLDAIGALYWNPATIGGLGSSELSFGMEVIYPNYSVGSTVGPFGGVTNAETGALPVPNVGWVHHLPDSPFTIGLGVNSVAGYRTNLSADLTNPVLTPQPGGLGRVSSEAQFLQLAPVLSVKVTDRLFVGAGPTITMGLLSASAWFFDAPNAGGIYPSAQGTRWHWGGGAQAGVYYVTDSRWHFGASIKSPTWMEEFRFHTQDATGAPRVVRGKFDLPLIASLGMAYFGFENLVLATDVRFLDYKNTDGFGDPAAFTPAGALQGLDWSSVFSVGTGAQVRLTERLYARMGYLFSQSPIRNSEMFYNVGSALFWQHVLSTGASFQLWNNTSLNFAYGYGLPSRLTGAIPGVAGSSVSGLLDFHVVDLGITMRR